MSTAWATWREQLPEDAVVGLSVLWGKSDADGRPNLLVQHLLDTAAVAELLWDRFLARSLQVQIDEVTEGRGRAFLTWLCALHDAGKATPAFQQQHTALRRDVEAAGLPFGALGARPNRAWRHERASARILIDAANMAGWRRESVAWVWPLLAGHHGVFPPKGAVRPKQRRLHGVDPMWGAAQQALVDLAWTAAGFRDLSDAEPTSTPSRAVQLALSGLVIAADWIASDEGHFPGVDDWQRLGLERAHERAERAWDALGLRRGWGRLPPAPTDPIAARFGVEPRPSQRLVVDAARRMSSPGLIVIEAPTGEGKTEAALAACEVLAARFGADGIFTGMPTQATTDPMLTRVSSWVSEISQGMPVALLHGKRRFNREWQALLAARTARATHDGEAELHDEYGVEDHYGAGPVALQGVNEGGEGDSASDHSVAAAQDWLLGAKRGLLAPTAVGTIDQLLFAATRTKHVALRFAGLVGKVVVLDEVHAADIYMEQFLAEALRWLGQANVPVILLSATVSPLQRHRLVQAYLAGQQGLVEPDVGPLDHLPGYPAVTTANTVEGRSEITVASARPWRSSMRIAVEIIEEDAADPHTAVAEEVARATEDGGCVLVLRNTVGRAQATYEALRSRTDAEVVLVHGRLSAADRAVRTEDLLRRLGPPGPNAVDRPQRLIVVATQVAEQSFDIDADVILTDLAPVDLLIQRGGRLHRHHRPDSQRPPALRCPRLLVTGLRRNDGPPVIDRGTLAVYGERAVVGSTSAANRARSTPYRAAAPLLATAALVEAAADGQGWVLPDEVPRLVEAAYGGEPIGPQRWHATERTEWAAFTALQERRAATARQQCLTRIGETTSPTLAGLHGGNEPGLTDDEMHAQVRDGLRSVEVVLVHDVGGRYACLDHTDLGIHGERIHEPDVLDALLGGTVRLPSDTALAEAARRLGPGLPEFDLHPWTRHANVLILIAGAAEIAGQTVRYDPALGLLVDRGTAETPA